MNVADQKTALIIGAGPAGLTAAYELIDKTAIKPIVYEMTNDIGGISKTINYNGNRIDIGGHRFFSKSDVVMDWWKNILPVQGAPAWDDVELKRELPLSKEPDAPDPEATDSVMLVRGRLSRIFFLRKFFDYPVSINKDTFLNLGFVSIVRIGISYVLVRLRPRKEEKSLEDFFINRFGKELYLTFFKDYTEKVWGVPCSEIKPEWGAQRIKGLSVTKAIWHALKKTFVKDESISQKNVETSLIEQFMYPKLGPGQLWEEVARGILERGAELHLNYRVTMISYDSEEQCFSVVVQNDQTMDTHTIKTDYVFSTMPVKDLVCSMGETVPANVRTIADGLVYRDFMTAGLLLDKLKIHNTTKIKTINNIVPDNWIYIQERDVEIGRLQIFNNWSPYMVKDRNKVWVGLEYFCNEGDERWSMADDKFLEFAIDELAKIDIIEKESVLDGTVIRMPKAYPAYFGTYDDFDQIRTFTDSFEHLFLIGRNGMHRYNNADHSMLTAMVAVQNIVDNVKTKDNIWSVNAESEYHESK